MRILLFFVLNFSIACTHFHKLADQRQPDSVAADFFDSQIDEVSLVADLPKAETDAGNEEQVEGFLGEKPTKKKSAVGKFSFKYQNVVHTFPVEIDVRGNTSKYDCSFPKLSIKFSTSTKGTPLQGHKKIRLNTHCSEPTETGYTEQGRVAGDRGPAREALAYRLQTALDIPGFRSKLTPIQYRSSNGTESKSHLVLMLESKDAMGNRTQTKVLEEEDLEDAENILDQLKQKSEAPQLLKTLLFQILLGNYDFSLSIPDLNEKRHFNPSLGTKGLWNLLLLKDSSETYRLGSTDYDMSSLVRMAPYELNKLDSEISGCKEGNCFSRFAELQKWRAFFSQKDFMLAFEHFSSKKLELGELITNDKILTMNEREFALRSLESFYWLISNRYAVPVLMDKNQKVYFDAGLKMPCGKTADGDSTEIFAPPGLPIKVLKKGPQSIQAYMIDTRDQSMTNPLDSNLCLENPIWLPKNTKIGTDWPQ